MEIIKRIIDFILHIDTYLEAIINSFGNWSYVILFLVVFIETGLVIMPFLPGDSLLFTAGAFAGVGYLNIWILYPLFILAAILGDSLNYEIGKTYGVKAFEINSFFLKKENLIKAEQFYEKYGGKAIMLARFVPLVRTFAPFVAGISNMKYSKFLYYNVIGGVVWVTLFLFGGFILGNIPFIKENLHYSVFIILFVSALPVAFEFLKAKLKSKE